MADGSRKERRRLQMVNLDDSIRSNLLVTELDQPRTETVASDRNLRKEMELIQARAEEIPNASNDVKSRFIAMELHKARGSGSHVEIRQVKDKSEDMKVSFFKATMLLETGTTLAQLLGTTFSSYPFGADELKKAEMEYLLLDYAIKKISARTIEPEGENRSAEAVADDVALKEEQLELLFERFEGLDLIKLRREHDAQIMQKTKTEALRSNTIAASYQDQLIPLPLFGPRNNLEPEAFKKLLGNSHGVTFGSAHTTQELRAYLEVVKAVCENVYTETATYQALKHVLCQDPRQFVQNCQSAGNPLEWAWVQLQVTYGETIAKADCPALLREAMRTRPVHLTRNMVKIVNLVREKNRGMDPDEKELLDNIEVRKYLMNYLRTWYPYHISQIEQRFNAVALEKKRNNLQQSPHDHTLNLLVREILADVQPVRLNFEQPRKGRSFINSVEAEEESTEEGAGFLNVDDPQEILINAFNNGDGGIAHHGGFNRPPKSGLTIPPDFRGRCMKCGDEGHFYKWCPKYKGNIQLKKCEYCGCYHTDKCLNVPSSKVNEMTTPKDPFSRDRSSNQTQ